MFKQNFYLAIFGIFQLFFTFAVVIGIIPQNYIYANLLLQIAALFLFDLEYALYSLILSVPFYLVIPNSKFDTLSAWRLTFAAAFAIFLWKKKAWPNKFWAKKYNWNFSIWDKYLYFLGLWILVSIFFEPFKTIGIKKLIFVLNAYLIYVLVRNIVSSKEQVIRSIAVTFSSIASIVLIGYVQYAATLKTNIYYFWQYWADVIAKPYYGSALSQSLTYSNSWFSFYKNAPPSLRMFSILPDSHAFALIAIFSIPLASALLFIAKNKLSRILLWVYIALAAIAIDLSGTRGAWLSLLPTLLLLIWLYYRHFGRKLLAKMFLPLVFFLVFLALSPFTQKLLNAISHGYNSGNFITRAASIYDLQESSNQGRLEIWSAALKYSVLHPLVGTGFGNFLVMIDPNAKSYDAAANALFTKLNLPQRYITAHSLYLDFLVETGTVGFILFLMYFYKIFCGVWQFFKEKYLYHDSALVFFTANFGLYLVWLMFYSFFDGTLLNDRVLIYFFLELAITSNIIALNLY